MRETQLPPRFVLGVRREKGTEGTHTDRMGITGGKVQYGVHMQVLLIPLFCELVG